MSDNDDAFIDSGSGISIEEQRDILYNINKAAEKNRRSLSRNIKQGGKSAVIAKKSGARFPLAVNIAALIILALGGFLLISFNVKKETQVRKGGAVYNLTEQALIDEIRKDTAQKIALKEMEIASVNSRLEEVDAQLTQLYSSNQIMSAEQITAQENLLAMQNTYRAGLFTLRDELSQILEASRLREAELRSRHGERETGSKDAAAVELERLTGEQEKIAAIDAQFSGGLASVSEHIQNGRFIQAAQTIESLRQFNSENNLAASGSYQTRKEFYNQALNSMEAMIDEIRKNNGADKDINEQQWNLQVKNSQLEETVAEMQKTIDALGSDASGQTRRLSQLEEAVSSLRAANSALETNASEKDKNIASLQTERDNLNQTVSQLQSANSTQEQEITTLKNQIAIIRQALDD